MQHINSNPSLGRLRRALLGSALLALLWLFCSMTSGRALAATIYVDDDAPGANNGASWNDAYVYLQDALAAANAGDEIWVAAGVYYPDEGGSATDNDRTATFPLKNGVSLYGGFAGSETASNQRNFFANLTILSGDIDQNDSNSDGNRVAETWNDIQGDNAYHVVTGSGVDGTAELSGFTITAGQTVADAPNNSCFEHLCGGGVFVNNGSPSLAFLVVSGNQAKHGGGMSFGYDSSPTLLNIIFRGNLATAFGGGIDLGFNSNPTLTNAVFSGNRADASGGGMAIVNSNPTLTSVTFSGNQGEAIRVSSANATLTNVIVWGNDPSQIDYNVGTATIRNSLIQGSGGSGSGWNASFGTDGGGNLDANPLFVDADGADNRFGTPDDNLRLLAGSPAIDRGDSGANSTGADLAGAMRIQGAAIDLGAYEGGICPSGSVLYVNGAATGNANGQSWPEALTSLQDALAVSAACANVTEIWVAKGVYYPDVGGGQTNDDRTATFQLGNNLAIYGGFAGTESTRDQRDPVTNVTVLSGDLDQNDTGKDANGVVASSPSTNLQGNNAYDVVTGDGVNNSAVLDGFTITAGRSEVSGSAVPNSSGGGFYIASGSPTLSNLRIVGNYADDGAGMYNHANSNPHLTNLVFTANQTVDDGAALYNSGNSNPVLTNVTISGNQAREGGGIFNSASSPVLSNVTISNNQARSRGGGLFNLFNDSNPVLTNVTFSSNQAADAGGAIYQHSGTVTLKNVTISDNTAPSGGAIATIGGVFSVTNSILANSVGGANCSGMIISGDYNLSSDASCSLDKPHDRASTDPKLAALADNEGATQTHALQTGSPAIDNGNCSDNTVTVDQRGVTRPQGPACDIGAYEVTGASAYDFGDAPDPTYPTLLASNGARHGLVSNRHLGATVDSETDGQPAANADGDDSNSDDEDGVVLPATLNTCALANLSVTAAAAGLLNGWIDFNADGDWGDAGEQIFRGLALNAGAQTLSFQVPCDAAIDIQTVARFRFGGTAILGPSGAAFDGEVEDYLVSLQRGNPLAQSDQAETNEDRPVLIDVLANDRDPVGGPLTLVAVTTPARGSAVIESGRVRYTPNVDFAGVDTFAYTLQNEVGKQVKAQVNIRVRAANDAPTNLELSNNSLTLERATNGLFSSRYAYLRPGVEIGRLSTSDPDPGDTHTYKTAFNSQGPFAVVDGALQTLQPIRIASASFAQYTVVIISTDSAGAAIERSFTVTLFGPRAPDGPVGMTLSKDQISENQPANTVVGVLSTTDAKSGVHTYALVSGVGSDNNSSFAINGNQLLANAPLDYEAKELYSIRVRTVNDKGAGMEQPFVIKVTDDNGEPGEPAPQHCAAATIKLIDTTDTLVEITDVAASSKTANGCAIQGKLHVQIPGSDVAGIAFTGRVDAKNQLYSDTRLQALNQQVTSSEAQTSAGIGAFTLKVAGLTLEVNKATVEYYLGRPSLRLAGAKWCLPAEWGGLCSPLSSNSIQIDASGLKATAGFLLPEIILGKVASQLSRPRLIGLKASLNSVAGGYEITAAGQLGIPKLPSKRLLKTDAEECGLTASLTIYVDAVTGATVMALNASATGPQTDAAIDGVALRQVSIGLKCSKGIPIDGTGLQLTGVRGTLSLRAGDQYISLGVTIETVDKAGPIALARLDGDAKVLWDPEWGFDLVATLKLLGFLEAARSNINIRENRFHFDGYIRGFVMSGNVRLDAWTRNGSFHMTGSGRYALGIAKGAILSGSGGLVMAAQTSETAGTLGFWDDVGDFASEAIDTVVDVGSAVIGTTSEVVNTVVGVVQRIISIELPPIDLTVGSVNGDFGRFTNNNWGIKGYIKLGDIVGDTAQDVLEFFHVPAEFGLFVDHAGNLDFGGVSEYTLVTPPPILAARQRWQMAQAAQGAASANVGAATDGQFSFVSENEVIIATPLTLEQPVVRAATVISQVRISAPSTVNFMLTSYEPLTMTLIAPDGTHITPANYNQPPINQKYQIDYGVRTIYETVARADSTSAAARLRFMPASRLPQFAAVDVLVDGVPVWKNVKPFNPATRDPDYDSNYLAIEPGLHTLSLVPTGQSTVIVSTTLDAQLGVGYTLATAGTVAPQLRLLNDEQATPPSFGQAYARFVHLGDADRKVTVLINGAPTFSNLHYRDASAYQLLPVGDVTIEVVDATTNAVIAPQRVLPLRDTSLVFTFFLFDYNSDAFTLDYIGAIDDLYLPHLYAIYAVGGADMGDWKVDLAGDLAGVNYALSVNAFAEPTKLSNVTVNVGNLSQTQVNWTLKSEFAPTLVTLYANPGALTSPLSYTNTNGISVTEQITNFMGFPVQQVTLRDPNQLNNAAGSLIANLTELESGTYRLWLQVDDGVNPPRSLYARDPGTGQIAVITVNNPNFPQSWTPTITPTIDADNALLGVQWTGLTHPDIDSYTLHLGTTPGASERTDSGLSPIYAQDEAGQAVGLPTVSGLFSNIEPGRTYYLYIEAIDEESSRVVRSPAFSVTISQGAFALTASSTHYLVARGSTIKAPLALEVTTPLFDPNVALAIYDEGLPRGIWAQFEHDLVGETSLQDNSSSLAISAAGVNPVSVHRAPVLAAVQTATLVITVTETVTDGLYPLTVIGYNGVDGEQSLTLYLQVGAVGFQAQTMCYGPDLDLRIPFGAAAAQDGIDLVVITGPLPPNLTLSGAATCTPYTGLRSMIELTNQLVTQGCADNAACNPVDRIVFDYDGSYRTETIQAVEVARDLFLPLVSHTCSWYPSCN